MTPMERMQEAVAGHLDEVRSYFKPGIKVTILVRVPDHPDRDFIMTDDDDASVIAMIQRRMSSP